MITELMIQQQIAIHNKGNRKYSRKHAFMGAKFFLAPCFFAQYITISWEQRKLSDMVERVTRKNENLESELPLTISAQYGLIDQNEFFDKRIASRDVSGYYLLKKGEFAYNKSTSSDAPWGAVKRLDRYAMGVLSTLYIVFALKEDGNIDSDFLVSYYDTDCWHKGVQAIAAEGARNHGLLNITPADYFETVLTVPSDVKEQHQIGTFFARLDSLITLHQRKYYYAALGCEKCREYNYTFSWEQRKLGECAEFNPKSELPDIFEYVDLESVVGTDILSHRTESKSSAPSRAQRLARKGDVFYQTVRPYQKNNCIFENDENNWVFSTGYAQLRPVNDGYFLLTLLQNEDFVKLVLDRCTGTSYPAINSNDLADIDVNIPIDNLEQHKIGDYFRNLDTLITLHQREPPKEEIINE